MSARETHRQVGFTLIELLVALAAGALVMLALAAAARMSAGTMTIANRIAHENALLRAGLVDALDEVDFWRSYDDPDAPPAQGQRLRPSIAMEDGHEPGHPIRLGMPFTPLAAAWPDNATETFDLDAKSWSSANRQARWRGNLMEKNHGDLRAGRYAMFSNAHRAPSLGSPDTGAFGSVTLPTERTWLASQMRGLNRALGYYGLMDYAPSNSPYAWYGEYRAPPPDPGADHNPPYPWRPGTSGHAPAVPWGTTNGGYDREFTRPMRGNRELESLRNPFFCFLGDWNNNNFLSIGGGSFAVVPPNNDVTRGLDDQQMVHYHRWWFYQLNVFTAASTTYAPTSIQVERLLPLAPTTWPEVSVSVRRSSSYGSGTVECGVRLSSPVTGHVSALNFTAFGTTLRGARMQRAPYGGWADWASARPATWPQHLDSP
ncbi:MAG TPA: prepilin-type N-terminal cleavage/methylation domain-containing protein [Planctomycetota bacterium]|nr:prepilin-type N-terminal cleavage/methylation domain-containing protein [Planctomycetota bacterium]